MRQTNPNQRPLCAACWGDGHVSACDGEREYCTTCDATGYDYIPGQKLNDNEPEHWRTEGERSPTYPAIRVYYDPKPDPNESHDWVAYFDSYEPGEPIGYGATRAGAIAALLLEVADE